MVKFIYYLLCGIIGAVLSTAGIGLTSWQFWVVVGCAVGAYICGHIIGENGD